MWAMFGILSSCPAFWHAVDALPYFEWSGLEGWLLTAIQSICFSFEIVRVDKRSPFKKLSLAKIVEKSMNTLKMTMSTWPAKRIKHHQNSTSLGSRTSAAYLDVKSTGTQSQCAHPSRVQQKKS